jgi:hypothetical protein
MALRHSFTDYSEVYADMQNRQMLLNLARLRDRHPIYFFQLTGLTASYTFTGTASLTATKGNSATNPTSAFTHTNAATIGGTATQNPIFTMIPLAGDKFAQQLLAPIKADVFYELYDQGWPLDELMRVLIDRVEVVYPNPGTDEPEKRAVVVLQNDPFAGSAGHYEMFLRACGMAREFQKRGALTLDHQQEFEALAAVDLDPPSAKQLQSASKDGLHWTLMDGKWRLGKMKPRTLFRIEEDDPATKAAEQILRRATNGERTGNPYVQSDDLVGSLKGVLLAEKERAASPNLDSMELFIELVKSFSVTEQGSTESKITTDSTAKSTGVRPRIQVQLVMRSLISALTAVAADEDGQAHLKRADSEFSAQIPLDQYRPTLQLAWPTRVSTTDPLVTVDYGHRKYAVADRLEGDGTPPEDNEAANWNRDIFRLLLQLSIEVTTDPSLLTAPSLIQLH